MEMYIVNSLKKGKNILKGEIFRHIFKVLKKRVNDELLLTDGNGKLGKGIVKEVGRDQSIVYVDKVEYIIKGNKELVLGFPLLKGSRTDFIIEKGTELNVDVFVPIIYRHSIVKEVSSQKMKRWGKIVEAASMQSLRPFVPAFFPPMNLKEFLSNFQYDVYYGSMDSKYFVEEVPEKVCIIVGPEGDFSREELNLLNERGKAFSLGTQRLRAETAAVVSAFLFSYKIYKKYKRKEVK